MRMTHSRSRRILPAACLLLLAACDGREEKTQLRVFVADSLARSFESVATAFEQEHPDTEVICVPSGSVLAARKLTEANDQADVLAVADYQVIERLLRPEYAKWYICFATNEIGIAYTDASRGASDLTADNWFEILAHPDTTVAAASPIHDPCGYWTELCWKLADLHYPPGQGGGRITTAMNLKCGPPDRRRSDSQQLMQLLETPGGLDYAFVYRSQALQHNLPFLRLPPEINLGSAAHLEQYRRASVEIPGDRRGTTFTRQGDAIVFAITIPRTVRHRDRAEQFVAHVLGDRARAILEHEYITLAEQAWTHDPEALPVQLSEKVNARKRPGSTDSRPAGADGQ